MDTFPCLRKILIVLAQNRRYSKLGALSPCPQPSVRGLGAGRLLRFSFLLGPRLGYATPAAVPPGAADYWFAPAER